MPAPLGDVWDAQRRWSTDGTLTKVFVVWIHRDRDILKLQCGLEEHKGPICTFHITEIEHPSNDEGVMDVDEDDTSDEDSEVTDKSVRAHEFAPRKPTDHFKDFF